MSIKKCIAKIDDELVSLDIVQCGLCATPYRMNEDDAAPTCVNTKCEEYRQFKYHRHVLLPKKFRGPMTAKTLIDSHLF